MNNSELILKTKREVDEISGKYKDLKDKWSQYKDTEIENEIQSALDRLDELNRVIQSQYERIRDARGESDARMSELQKVIYRSIESFNDSFTKAGSLFKKY